MNYKHILVADDESLTRKSLYEILKFEGYRVSMAADGQEAWDIIAKDKPDIVITDLKMPKMNGLELLRKIKDNHSEVAVVLITAHGSIENAVAAMKEGAFDYVTKPIVDNEIKIVIERIFEQRDLLEENKSLKKKIAANTRCRFHDIIGQSPAMQKIYNLIEAVASTSATVFIQGESGTGKRLIAQAIHKSDASRKKNPFVEVSCGALPESLLESELFGHIKGSFTGAIRDRKGRFEAANRGTIFLDEIDAFTPQLQVKLLRVLQEGEFECVGDTQTRQSDARVIAATNQDLKKCIKEGSFREDLYYRLHVIPIVLPPLRERKDDIPFLVEHLLNKYSQREKTKNVYEISEAAMNRFLAYDWPGNVRELENIIERAVILCKGESVEEEDIPEFFSKLSIADCEAGKQQAPLKEALKLSEKELIEQALNGCEGNRKKAAESLGINRTTLYNKMKEYKLL